MDFDRERRRVPGYVSIIFESDAVGLHVYCQCSLLSRVTVCGPGAGVRARRRRATAGARVAERKQRPPAPPLTSPRDLPAEGKPKVNFLGHSSGNKYVRCFYELGIRDDLCRPSAARCDLIEYGKIGAHHSHPAALTLQLARPGM